MGSSYLERWNCVSNPFHWFHFTSVSTKQTLLSNLYSTDLGPASAPQILWWDDVKRKLVSSAGLVTQSLILCPYFTVKVRWWAITSIWDRYQTRQLEMKTLQVCQSIYHWAFWLTVQRADLFHWVEIVDNWQIQGLEQVCVQILVFLSFFCSKTQKNQFAIKRKQFKFHSTISPP